MKECGVRLICDEDLQQEGVTNLSSMLQDLANLKQHGGAIHCYGPYGDGIYSFYNFISLNPL